MEVLGSSCSKAPQGPVAQATVAPELGPRGQRRVGGLVGGRPVVWPLSHLAHLEAGRLGGRRPLHSADPVLLCPHLPDAGHPWPACSELQPGEET